MSNEEPIEGKVAGVSAFIANVLQQLSLTSWLPAAMLTANVTLIAMFRADGRIDFVGAVATLAGQPFGLLVGWVLLWILITTLTQAFERQAIMAVQGDWPTRGPTGVARRVLVRRHRSRLLRLEQGLRQVNEEIVAEVAHDLIDNPPDWTGSPYHEDERKGALLRIIRGEGVYGVDDALADEAYRVEWSKRCAPELVAKRRRIQVALEYYPELDRILPSKLGNMLTATYDDLRRLGVNDIDFALIYHEQVPSKLSRNYDSARGHLNMYCTMVFVFAGLTLLTLVALGVPTGPGNAPQDLRGVFVLALAYAALAWLSYSAALRAGEFMGRTLRTTRSYLAGKGVSL